MIIKIAKAVWIGSAVTVLAVTVYAFDGKPDNDIGVFLAWSMLFLSFPSGLIVSFVHMVLYEYFSVSIATTHASLALDWAGFFILGYLQWFKVVPYLVARLRALGERR